MRRNVGQFGPTCTGSEEAQVADCNFRGRRRVCRGVLTLWPLRILEPSVRPPQAGLYSCRWPIGLCFARRESRLRTDRVWEAPETCKGRGKSPRPLHVSGRSSQGEPGAADRRTGTSRKAPLIQTALSSSAGLDWRGDLAGSSSCNSPRRALCPQQAWGVSWVRSPAPSGDFGRPAPASRFHGGALEGGRGRRTLRPLQEPTGQALRTF